MLDDLPGDGPGLRFTAALHHWLTPSGFALKLEGLFDTGTWRLAASLWTHHNQRLVLPAVGLELLELGAEVWGRELRCSPRLLVWTQPEGLRFDSNRAQLGALVGVHVRIEAMMVVALAGCADGITPSDGTRPTVGHTDLRAAFDVAGASCGPTPRPRAGCPATCISTRWCAGARA